MNNKQFELSVESKYYMEQFYNSIKFLDKYKSMMSNDFENSVRKHSQKMYLKLQESMKKSTP